MKIINVVVEKLPNGCGDCRYIHYSFDGVWCDTNGRWIEGTDAEDLTIDRPSWCPLVVEDN